MKNRTNAPNWGGGGIQNSCKDISLVHYFDTENRQNERDTHKNCHNDSKKESLGKDLISCQNDAVISQGQAHCSNFQNSKLNDERGSSGGTFIKQSKASYKKYFGMVFCVVIMFLGMLMGMTYASLSSSKTATGTISFTLPQGVSAGFEANMPTLYIGTSVADVYFNGKKLTQSSSETYTLNCKKSGQYLRLQFTLPTNISCTLSSSSLTSNGLTWQLSYSATNNTLLAYTSSATTNASYKISLDSFLTNLKTTKTQENIVDEMWNSNLSDSAYNQVYNLGVEQQISIVANMSATRIDSTTTFSSSDADIAMKCFPKMLFGAGTEQTPYEISTKNDFLTFMYTSSSYKGANYVLKNDLSLIGGFTFDRNVTPWNELTGSEITGWVSVSDNVTIVYIPPFVSASPLIFYHSADNSYVDWSTQTTSDCYMDLYTYSIRESLEFDYSSDDWQSIVENFIKHLCVVNGFDGKFDGGGHNLTGYFPYSLFYDCKGAVIENLTVNGCAGGAGIASCSNVTIRNCTNNAIILNWASDTSLGTDFNYESEFPLNPSARDKIGGICNECVGEVTNCVNNSVMDSSYDGFNTAMTSNCGIGTATTIIGCTNNGRIRGSGYLVGIGEATTIKYCNNNGAFEPTELTGSYFGVCGISSNSNSSSYTYYCKNYGDVYFGYYLNEGTDYEDGLLVGIAYGGTIENCYSTMDLYQYKTKNLITDVGLTNNYILGITVTGTIKCCYYTKPNFESVNNARMFPKRDSRASYTDNTNFGALVVIYGENGIPSKYLESDTRDEKQAYKGKLRVEEAMAQYALDKGY